MDDVFDRTIVGGRLVSFNYRARPENYSGKRLYTSVNTLKMHGCRYYYSNGRAAYRPYPSQESGSVYWPDSMADPSGYQTFPSSIVSETHKKARAKLIDTLGNANALLSELIKERMQTTAMVGNLVLSLVQTLATFKRKVFEYAGAVVFKGATGVWPPKMQRRIRRMKKRFGQLDLPTAKDLLKHNLLQSSKWATNKWLEYRYGWTPLIGAVDDLINKPLQPLYGVFSESASMPWYTVILRNNGTDKQLSGGRMQCIMRCVVTPKTQHNLAAEQYGLTRWGLAKSVWELTPFSFVADWFVGVGDYLEYLCAIDQVNLIDSSRTYKYRGQSSRTATFSGLFAPGTYSSRHEFRGGIRSIHEIWDGLFEPPPIYDVRNNMNFTRTLDAISLCVQRFRKA